MDIIPADLSDTKNADTLAKTCAADVHMLWRSWGVHTELCTSGPG